MTLLETTHNEASCLSAFDQIRAGFGQRVNAANGGLVVESVGMDWIDERNDVLQVTIDFYPVSEISGRTEDGDLMEDLTVNTNMEVD